MQWCPPITVLNRYISFFFKQVPCHLDPSLGRGIEDWGEAHVKDSIDRNPIVKTPLHCLKVACTSCRTELTDWHMLLGQQVHRELVSALEASRHCGLHHSAVRCTEFD